MTVVVQPDWRMHPGQAHDKKGVPIYPGDLIRTFHFIGARRKRHFLYHTAVYVNGYMELVPTCHLHPEKVSGGGRCALSQADAEHTEVIAGNGPEPYLGFEDRPKKRPASRSEAA